MTFCRDRVHFCLLVAIALGSALLVAQAPEQSSSSHSPKHVKKPASELNAEIDPGAVSGGVYHNKALGLACKIPAGWVMRTEEMNAREEGSDATESKASPQGAQRDTEDKRAGRVLLAAFSRPPEARGEEVNSSLLIVVESTAAYPGLKEAAQYFGPLKEVTKAQGFVEDEEPYEIALDGKTLVRADFHKDVGSRMMRQSTLAFLARGYAVSITVIGGTEDEVEELIDGISFSGK